MKKYIATMCALVALVAAAFVGTPGTALGKETGAVNWKSVVAQDCHRLVVNAKWVRVAYKAGHPNQLQNRIARLKRTTMACGEALRTIPGS